MTTWTWYAAGLMTALILLPAALICIYALTVSGATSQAKEKPHNADTADYKRNT